ncbi:MAG TPA: 50S ribosomal protein L24 [Opitutae bacterium]|nr:50S ribosomal protein L24 [Opitutae bacterium]|tara:strand:+ start:1708 stop:1962 length:255 start_codon:yes stop_codon:yes gene_type:complete
MKFKIKRGDEVVVLAGSQKGKKGKILDVFPSKERVVVEGVKMGKRHTKATQDNPQGAIIEREMPIHYSNVMLVSRHDARKASRK